MFGPKDIFFQNIKLIWEMNNLPKPLDIFCGFVSDTTNLIRGQKLTWEKIQSKEIEAMAYLNLNNETQRIQANEITIDYYVSISGIKPKALNIDVEGSEMNVLLGAKNTLKETKPYIWLSIHNDLLANYGYKENEIIEFLAEFGYECQFLEYDHEGHWFCYPLLSK